MWEILRKFVLFHKQLVFLSSLSQSLPTPTLPDSNVGKSFVNFGDLPSLVLWKHLYTLCLELRFLRQLLSILLGR